VLRAVSLVALVACVAPAAPPRTPYRADVDRALAASSAAKQVAAPTALEPKPWKVGQWARFRAIDAPGYDEQAVVAEDGCGFWIEMKLVRYDRRLVVLVCMRSPSTEPFPQPLDLLQIAIVRSNDGVPTVTDFRNGANAARKEWFAGFVKELLPGAALANAADAREDVDVPAGHFAGAVRVDYTDFAAWIRPDVPLGGTVKTRTRDGREAVLIAYGDDRVESVLPELAAARTTTAPPSLPRPLYALAIGLGALTGAAGESSTTGVGFGGALGAHVRRDLDVLIDANAFFQESYSPDLGVQQNSATVVLGVRWFPWRRDLFVQGDIGAALVIRRASTASPSTTTAGFAAGATLGWFWLQRRGFGLAYELGDRIGIYGSREGVRHNLAMTVMIEVSP
jgi:hypothetical protein